MYKTVIILYILCFGSYILFCRQPDYFDGEITSATIHLAKDSALNKQVPKAFFTVGKDSFSIAAAYPFRSLKEGEGVSVIYDSSKPAKAAVYSWWGYWITIGELTISILLLFVLFQIAVAVTKRPSAESLVEQLEHKEEKKKKYSD